MSEPKEPSTGYSFRGDNIYRGEEHVANYDSETRTVTPAGGHANFLSAVKRFLTSEGIEWEKDPEAAAAPAEKKEAAPAFVPPVPLHDPDGPPPATEAELGSLTPVYMVWNLQKGEDVFRAAYDGKVTPIGDFMNGVIDFPSLTQTYLGK